MQSETRSESEFWTKFESFLRYELPNDIKNILNRSGFNSFIALSEMNSEMVLELEKFESIKTSSKFTFLPGHKALLLGLPKKIQEFEQCKEENRTAKTDILELANVSFLMKELVKTALNNYNVEPKRRRYSDSVRNFAIYLYMMCGRQSYEILSSNIPLPHPSTILTYISNNKQSIVEGQLRAKELSDYLKKVNAPQKVWLSEDGSGIISKVSYDTSSNQMVGLVLPTNEETGMPIPFTYVPESVGEIEEHLQRPKSTTVYVVMAQALKENVPPFVLQIFGTDEFTSENVMKRWAHTKIELAKFDIEVCGISSDADPKLLSAMIAETGAMLQSNPNSLLEMHGNLDENGMAISYVQDLIHVETKLRNRLLKASVHLPIGSTQVSVGHLKILIDTVSKEIHGLVQSDICPQDRQNFRSLQKCFDERVLNALKMYVPGSEGTVAYMQICREMYTAFTDPDLRPIERLRRMWRSTYFIRAWRRWILNTQNTATNTSQIQYSVGKNCISSVSYSCVELNAYQLLHLIVKLRNAGTPELFIPSLFSSQTCEETFRSLRSMTTIYWTRINFSLLELLHMIGRLELKNEIVHDKLSTSVNFPRVQNKKDKCVIYDLPTNDEIKKVLEEVKILALSDAAQLGMLVIPDEICVSTVSKSIGNRIKKTQQKSKKALKDIENTQDIPSCDESEESDVDENSGQSNNDNRYQEPEENILSEDFLRIDSAKDSQNNTKYVEIKNKDGSVRMALKSSVIWALTESPNKLSKDRLRRVQSASTTPSITPNSTKTSRKRRLDDESQNSESIAKKSKKERHLSFADELIVGDWCLFQNTVSMNDSENSEDESGLVIGMILGFRYMQGRTDKEKQYSLNSAPISANNTSNRGVEVLATWKNVAADFVTSSISENNSYFIDINKYIASVKMAVDVVNQKNFKIDLSLNELQQIFSKQRQMS